MLKKILGIATAVSITAASFGGVPVLPAAASVVTNDIPLSNAGFEEMPLSVPGWNFHAMTNDGTWKEEPMNSVDLYANITNQTNGTAGNNRALRFTSTNSSKSTWFTAYSDPIAIPEEAKGKDLNLKFDYLANAGTRVYHSLAFCSTGKDGIAGNEDDYVLKSSSLNAATGERTGGSWKKYLNTDLDRIDGLTNSGGCYFGWDSSDPIASLDGFQENSWASVDRTFQYAERVDPYNASQTVAPDYVRVVFFTDRNTVHRGVYNAIYDNVKVAYDGGELSVTNGDFEADFDIPGWSKVTGTDGVVDYPADPAVTYSVSDHVDTTDFTKPGSFAAPEGKFMMRTFTNVGTAGDYFWSDPVNVTAGRDYKLQFQFYSTYRLSYGFRFFNGAGQVYDVKTKSFVDATKANLIDGSGAGQVYPGTQERNLYHFELGDASMKNQWAACEDDFTAPAGAVTARVFLYAPEIFKQTLMYDNIKITESYEAAGGGGDEPADLTVRNGGFEEMPLSVPGWHFEALTNDGAWKEEPLNSEDLYANITFETKAGTGGNRAMRFVSTNNAKSTWFAGYSDPIVIPEEAKGKDLNLQFDYMANAGTRVYYSLAFCRSGTDGKPGTADDYILKSSNLNAATGERTGGNWRFYLRTGETPSNLERMDGLASSGGCYFGWDSSDPIASMNGFVTNEWGSVNQPFQYTERDSIGPDYVRVVFFTDRNAIHQGVYNAIYDNVKVTYDGGEIPVPNGDFEADFEIPGWDRVTDKDGNKVDYEPNTAVSYAVTDSVNPTDFTKPGSFAAPEGKFMLRAFNNPNPRDKGDYFWSEPLNVTAGKEYDLNFKYFTSYRMSYGFRFFNEAGQVYDVKTSSFVDATKANLIDGSGVSQVYPPKNAQNLYVVEFGDASMKGRWVDFSDSFTAPEGAATARVFLFSPAGSVQICMYDDVRVSQKGTTPVTKYAVKSGAMTNGSVTSDVSMAAKDATVTLTVTPASKYRLSALTVTGDSGAPVSLNEGVSSEQLTYTFSMPEEAVTVNAEFEKIPVIDERPENEGEKIYLNVPNPKFERGNTGKNQTIPGWNPIGTMKLSDSDLYYEMKEGAAQDGSRALHLYDALTGNVTGNGIQLISDSFPVPAGNEQYKIEYTLEFDYKSSNYGGWGLNFYNKDGQVWNGSGWKTITDAYSEYIAADTATYKSWGYPVPYIQNQWEHFSTTLLAPAGTTEIKVVMLSSPNYANDYYVEDVRVWYAEDTTPAGEVTELQVQEKNSSVLLKWKDPTDKDFENIQLEVWADDLVGEYKIAPGVCQHSVTGLTNGVQYTFILKTVDSRNNVSTGVRINGTPNAGAVNHPPVYTGETGDREIWADEKIYLNLNELFTDPDSDDMTFRANVGTISSGNEFSFAPDGMNSQKISLFASDGQDETEVSFNVTVKAVPDETPEGTPLMRYLNVPNPKFERGTPVKNHEFPGWNPMGKMNLSDTHYYELNASAGKDGASQGLVLNDTLNVNALGYGLQVASAPFAAAEKNKDEAVEYTFSFDYNTTRAASYFVNFYDKDGKVWNGNQWTAVENTDWEHTNGIFNYNDLDNTLKGKWNSFSTKVTAPAGTVLVKVGFMSSPYWTFTAQIDNVKMGYSTNASPVIANPIADKNIKIGETVTVDIANVFTDPDGDAMTYKAGKGSLNGTVLTYRPKTLGTETVEVTATDVNGNASAASFKVTAGKNENLLLPDGDILKIKTGSYTADLIISNPGFEADGGWNGVTDKNGNAISSNNDTDCSFAIAADAGAQAGAKVLQIKKTNKEKEVYVWSDAVEVSANMPLDLSFQFRTANSLGYAVKFFDADGKLYDTQSKKYVDSTKLNLLSGNSFQSFSGNDASLNKWILKNEKLTVPEGAVTARVMFFVPRGQAAEFSVDSVGLKGTTKEPLVFGRFAAYKGAEKLSGLSQAKAGDTVTLKTTLKNVSDDILTATVVVVKYGENGGVEDVKTNVLVVPVTGGYELSIDYTLENNKGSIAVMLWDSLSGMNAFGRPTVIEQ